MRKMNKCLQLYLSVLFGFLFLYNQWICFASDESPVEKNHHHHDEESHHKAHHGGVLNVIDRCETGHIEIRIHGDTLEAWFVGGGHDTYRSVPIEADEILLKVAIPNRREKTLVMKADPMKLAGEKLGHYSRFTGSADWLSGIEKFEASGDVIFKGIRRSLIIKYPEGYDPEHGVGVK